MPTLEQYHDVLMADGNGANFRRRLGRLPRRAKLVLLVRLWITFAQVRFELRRRPLAGVVARLSSQPVRAPLYHDPIRLSRAITRGLRIGPWQPRCLIRSLVLYRLLRAQGDPAELVIGLPGRAMNADAHAWIELFGHDVGPLPGRRHHAELVRYPRELDHYTKPVG
jgi:hypothetical protein